MYPNWMWIVAAELQITMRCNLIVLCPAESLFTHYFINAATRPLKSDRSREGGTEINLPRLYNGDPVGLHPLLSLLMSNIVWILLYSFFFLTVTAFGIFKTLIRCSVPMIFRSMQIDKLHITCAGNVSANHHHKDRNTINVAPMSAGPVSQWIQTFCMLKYQT